MRDWFGICYTTSDTSSNATSAETTNAPTCSTTTVSTTLCAALQDDFHWWHTINDESDESGKLLLVDCNHNAKSASNERVIQVYTLFLLTHCKRSISLISWMVLILFCFYCFADKGLQLVLFTSIMLSLFHIYQCTFLFNRMVVGVF